MINASIQSFNGDNRQLELLIRNNISIEASKVNSNELKAFARNKSDKETAYDQFAVEHANTTFRLYQFSDLADAYANNSGSINLNEVLALVDSIYYNLDQLHDKEGAQHVRVHFEKEHQDSGLSNVLKLPSPEKDNQQDLTL